MLWPPAQFRSLMSSTCTSVRFMAQGAYARPCSTYLIPVKGFQQDQELFCSALQQFEAPFACYALFPANILLSALGFWGFLLCQIFPLGLQSQNDVQKALQQLLVPYRHLKIANLQGFWGPRIPAKWFALVSSGYSLFVKHHPMRLQNLPSLLPDGA